MQQMHISKKYQCRQWSTKLIIKHHKDTHTHTYMEHVNKFEINFINIIYSEILIIITTIIQRFINRLEKKWKWQ